MAVLTVLLPGADNNELHGLASAMLQKLNGLPGRSCRALNTSATDLRQRCSNAPLLHGRIQRCL